MNSKTLAEFVAQYNVFKTTPEYAERLAQLCIVPVLRRLIQATLSNNELTKGHLTGLLQACHVSRGPEIFLRYLSQNVADEGERADIAQMYDNCGQRGITGGGKGGVYGTSAEELIDVRRFLLDAFAVTDVAGAQALVRAYDALGVREVKQGVYSAWLYYINPTLFPIYNASHTAFKTWLQIPDNYADCIADFAELREALGGEDLGLIDRFAYKYSAMPIMPERDLDAFYKRTDDFFRAWWRCAPSWRWDLLRDLNKLTMLELDASVDFKSSTISSPKIDKWVNRLATSDLVVIMDKYYYYGIGVAESSYSFHSNDQFIADKPLACIDVRYLHKLTSRADHHFNISHRNPATFSELELLGFSAKKIFEFLDQNFPDALNSIEAYMNEIEGEEAIQKQVKKMEQTPNIILYGPPGTGKTFHSISYAVAIIEGAEPEKFIAENESDDSRKAVKQRFDEYIKAGQIQFCTFHQSLGYEDFIEGIKPSPPNDEDEEPGQKAGLSYEVADGMFKRLCTEAAYAFVGTNEATEAGHVLEFSDAYDRLASKAVEARDAEAPLRIPTRTGADIIIEDVSRNGNMSVRHETGGRKYIVSKARLGRIAQAFPDLDAVENIHDQFRGVIGGSNATAYYAVLREIRGMEAEPQEVPAERARSYEEKSAAVKELTQAAFEQGTGKRFVLIIDEINRGNVSSIFGELITLLEEDKRLGKPEALRAKLPYSGEDFGVPPNLYVIGTMNTADRSVEALDTALRRRFAFVHKGPQPEKLDATPFEGIDLQKLLTKLNRRLTILVDADHTIGHAWLMGVQNLDLLKDKFKAKILPLLQEYFYNDYEKLGLVLGNDFFKAADTAGEAELANFNLAGADAGSYSDKVILELKNVKDLHPGDFIRIYNPKYNADAKA